MSHSNNIMDFGDVIDFFSEDSVVRRKASRTFERIQAEQNQACPPGTRCPIILATDENTSPEELEILDRFHQQQEQSLQSLCGLPTPEPVTPPPVSSPSSWLPILPVVDSIRNLFRHEKEKKEPTVYELTAAVLNQVRLLNYEGVFYRQEGAVFVPIDETELQKMLFILLEPLLASGMNQRVLTQVSDMLHKNPRLSVPHTTESPDRVFFQNGPYDLEHHTFSMLSPLDFFTSFLPFDYRPEQRECPSFDRFVATVSGGDPMICQLIWEVLGYLLTYDMAGKAFFVLQGVGDSGKSVFGNLVSSFFNPEALAHLDIYRFKDRFSTSALRGKRLNICMDLPRGKISREAIGTIKMLTGDDTITIEEKFRQSQSYKPTCKLLFGSNFPLMPSDNDAAFRTRLVTIPFQYAIPKGRQDKHLLDKLMGERSAIAVKALDAYLALKRRNYQFSPIQGLCNVTAYVEDSELMEQFVNTCCEFRPECSTFTADLLDAYNAFRAACNAPPIMDIALFSRQFNAFCGDRVQGRRFRRDGQNRNGYRGVALHGQLSASEEVPEL